MRVSFSAKVRLRVRISVRFRVHVRVSPRGEGEGFEWWLDPQTVWGCDLGSGLGLGFV